LIEAFLDERIQKKIYSACAVVAGNTEGIFQEIYRGTISSESEIAVGTKSYFDLQSITKSVVTSPLVHVLIEKKAFSLSDVVTGGATVRDLLLHTAGFSDKDLNIRISSPFAAWERIFRAKPRSTPGERIEYADLNYRLLGRFIELRMGACLQDLARELVWLPLGITELTYVPFDTFNTTGVPRSHGRIDDDGVFKIGTIVGDDGVFGTARGLASFLSAVFEEKGPLRGYTKFLEELAIAEDIQRDFFESLRYGTKNFGWEINEFGASYAGPLRTPLTIEKSGGAGTFIWLDLRSGDFCVYLTNYGKPEPFKRNSWNQLVENVSPDLLSAMLFT
jgi:serine-type D-Ala-D-Ala carboxypeptidase